MKKLILILCLAYQVSQAQETKPIIPVVATFTDVSGPTPVYFYMGRYFIIRVSPNGKTRKQFLTKGLVKTLQR
jgi:hypothetical protein